MNPAHKEQKESNFLQKKVPAFYKISQHQRLPLAAPLILVHALMNPAHKE
jgi:hypothetical protein